MSDPIAFTLGALAFLDPAIRTCRKAYGVHKLTKHFGEHYVGAQRRVRGEQARLELILDTRIACVPDAKLCGTIIQELGSVRQAFQGCQDLIASIDRPRCKYIYSLS